MYPTFLECRFYVFVKLVKVKLFYGRSDGSVLVTIVNGYICHILI